MNPADPKQTRARSARAPSRRRRLVVAVLIVLTGAIPCGWIVSHTVPRFDTFIDRRGAIASVDAKPEITTEEGFVTQVVGITADTGLRVNLRVLRPSNQEQSRPLVILLAGHRTGSEAVSLVGDPKGIVIAALDYPYHGPERPRGVRQSLEAIPRVQQALLDTPPAISLALDWLLLQPWVDQTQIELMGVSLGVPFAAVAGTLDDRFRRVWLIHGGSDNRAWLANRLERRIRHANVRQPVASLLHLLAYGPSFRTVEWVPQIAPRPVMIVGADGDEQMPRESVEHLFAAAREPKELIWSQGRHVGTRRPDIVRQLLDIVRSRIELPQRNELLDTTSL